MKYSSALKGKEVLQYATWVNLENIMLSEISQSQKEKKAAGVHLIKVPRVVKIMDEEWNGGCQGLGGGEMGSCATGTVPVLQGNKVLEKDADGCTIV